MLFELVFEIIRGPRCVPSELTLALKTACACVLLA